MTGLRLRCTQHNINLKNSGSSQIFYPTQDEPATDADGWWEFDMSEYYCPSWEEEGSNECSDHHEVQVK